MKNLILSVICFIVGISNSAQNWCGTVAHQESLIENQPEKAAALKKEWSNLTDYKKKIGKWN